MTKLDEFAKAAMIGLLSQGNTTIKLYASMCYDVAESMLKESEKRNPTNKVIDNVCECGLTMYYSEATFSKAETLECNCGNSKTIK